MLILWFAVNLFTVITIGDMKNRSDGLSNCLIFLCVRRQVFFYFSIYSLSLSCKLMGTRRLF